MANFDKALFSAFQLITGFLDRSISGSYVQLEGLTDDPYPQYARIASIGPVVRHYGINGWFIVGFDAVRDAMQESRFGVDPRKSPFLNRMFQRAAKGEDMRFFKDPTMLNLDPPDHTRLRKLARQGFLHNYIQSLAPTISHLVEECLATVDNQGRFDLVETLARPLPAFLIADILGVPRQDRQQFQLWSEAITKHARTLDYELLRSTSRTYNELMDYLAGLAEQKRANPGNDLISRFIAAEAEGDKLTTKEIHSTSALLLMAGHETTTRLIGNAVWLLLKHPEQLQQLRANPDLLPNVVEEVLRFESPVQHTTRIALTDLEFHGQRIKKFQLLELFIGAANRDPTANEHPERFDIRRDNVRHVGFGYGIHLCLGAELARLETTIALQILLAGFPDLKLASDTPEWGDSDFVRGLDELIVTGSPSPMQG